MHPDTNPILHNTRDPDYSQLFVILPDKKYVKMVYESQPFFGCLLVHKMTHPCLCPFVKYSKDVCIVSNLERSPTCIKDMNHDTCARQLKSMVQCPGSAPYAAALAQKRKGSLPVYHRRRHQVRRSQSVSQVRQLQGAWLPHGPVLGLLQCSVPQRGISCPERQRVLERTEEPVVYCLTEDHLMPSLANL